MILVERICNKSQSLDQDQRTKLYSSGVKGSLRLGLTSLTIHRILVCAIHIAQKYFDDNFYGNKSMAIMFGISIDELNLLEMICLDVLDFDVHICAEEFYIYREKITSHIDLCQQSAAMKEYQVGMTQFMHIERMFSSSSSSIRMVQSPYLPPSELHATFI